jgi:hypothetical protein
MTRRIGYIMESLSDNSRIGYIMASLSDDSPDRF